MNNTIQIREVKNVDKNGNEYRMKEYETQMPWGKLRTFAFLRPENDLGNLKLITVCNQWRTKDDKFRSNKQYQIIENDKVVEKVWANVRYNSETNKEYLDNSQEISLFFGIWNLYKRLHRLEASASPEATE